MSGYGIEIRDADGRVRLRIGDLRALEPRLYDIPGWPPYKVRSSDLQVLSFHSQKSGYALQLCKRNETYNRREDGYSLYYQGDRGYVTVSELRNIVEVNQRKKEMPQYASARGGLKSGDLIIGSYTKDSKAVSFSPNPMVQDNLASAKVEAARLASLEKSKKFVVVRVEAVASAADINWE